MKVIYHTIYALIACLATSLASNQWPNHDISTLRLLQIVHRHGDRSPYSFASNDPFNHHRYWSAGIGELSNKGKYRLYKLGQFIRNEYNPYLGDKYSPREVYARSSISERCIESVSCLLSGAYPPKQHEWQWNKDSDAELGTVWQPFPIETFMPHSDDLVCNTGPNCHLANEERKKIQERPEVKQFLKDNEELYKKLSKIMGKDITSITTADEMADGLTIEIDNGLFWNDTWSEEEERHLVKQLYESRIMAFKIAWDSPILRCLIAGGLVKELNKNIEKVLHNKNDKKLYIYSTHDSDVGAVMNALGIFNGLPPPFAATLLFELHENKDSEYYLKVYYQNSTEINTGVPHPLEWSECHHKTDCPIDDYKKFTKHLLYEDFAKECNQKF